MANANIDTVTKALNRIADLQWQLSQLTVGQVWNGTEDRIRGKLRSLRAERRLA